MLVAESSWYIVDVLVIISIHELDIASPTGSNVRHDYSYSTPTDRTTGMRVLWGFAVTVIRLSLSSLVL